MGNGNTQTSRRKKISYGIKAPPVRAHRRLAARVPDRWVGTLGEKHLDDLHGPVFIVGQTEQQRLDSWLRVDVPEKLTPKTVALTCVRGDRRDTPRCPAIGANNVIYEVV